MEGKTFFGSCFQSVTLVNILSFERLTFFRNLLFDVGKFW